MRITLLLHNIRSTHNVGSLLRTCDGFGVAEVVFSGYTPYPHLPGDDRLPHLSSRQTAAIHKTALGAEASLSLRRSTDVQASIENYRREGYRIVALEQHPDSRPLAAYEPPDRCLLIVGEEVSGIPQDLLAASDDILEIPMRGKKESFNVSVAGAIALYHLTR